MEHFEWIIDEAVQNERLDKWISSQDNDWSRTQVQQWMKEGNLKVNGKNIKSNYKCQKGDKVLLEVPEPKILDVEPEEMNLDIVYEDQHVLVVNKPRGMVVHPAPGHLSGTLVNGLMAHCKDLSGINGVLRPGIVHRIDKDTSGLLMVAKNDKAHESLVNQLKDKTTTRIYKAITHGVIAHDHGTIDAPIGRDRQDRQSMTVTDENSKEAVTHFTVLERLKDFSLIECTLETGRTHQIRVHLKYIGHPIAGDPKYGPPRTLKLPINGQALHAAVLGFTHPVTNERLTFERDVPEDFQHLLNEIRKTSN
ncbi:pseudouridine synthase [Anaerobacillus alkalidiazotrophicus]|uniref:Pseudouridine synthase n=1 Tax=Anaerobacillus alkalidiazotrophicus TaxID=472963 RepID=A0A1S2LZV1_9BACI|nr:RluA family pseudouridine synthase [Anaerobacillus alkalidiazotrophicus]OIJ17763.1 pseudouridine synthase [Anaerobacillus alkalidiazotrophicus]